MIQNNLILGLVFFLGLSSAHARKTNVVFILTDNHGAWTLGCYGNPDIRTPNIDQMAADGIRFSHAFANNAVCSPTRATYLTGLMPSQHGVHNYLTRGRLQMGSRARNTLQEFTSLPEVLKAEGYTCGLVGKWHLGDNLHPQEGLDDYWITMPHGGTNTFHNAEVIEKGEVRKEPTYLTQLWTERACQFIEENREEPFFLFLSFNGPYGLGAYQLESSGNQHADYYSDKSLDSFPRGAIHPWQDPNRAYFGNPVSIRRYAEELSAIDDGVGAVLGKLKQLEIEEDTLVVFAADQGWAGGQHGLWGMGDHTRPLNAFEHSMHIPLIFHHPEDGNIPPGRVSDLMVSNYDFMPSLLGYLGLESKMPRQPKSPGRDFSEILRGQPPEGWNDMVFYEYENLRCVRTRDWKYIERYEEGYDELYNLAEDPGELHNLISDSSVTARREELQAQLDAFFAEYASPQYDLWNGGRSQTRELVWGKEAADRRAGNDQRSGRLPSAIDLSVNVPPMRLPDGLIAEVAAAPPLTKHPMMGSFDDRGRLFVAEAAGVNRSAEELDVETPNFIRMLEDTNRDGLFDRSTIFADNLTFPSGALWHGGALWVTAAPSIWRFEDVDDDGIADSRQEVVSGFGYTGNAADLHGPFLHPNGRIFWCHGRKDLDVHDQNGKRIHKGKGARIWSCEPDGSDVQVYAGGGMDNPVEIDFTPEGEIVGTINLMYGRPRGDTLVHWQYGGVYPRYDQEAVLAEFPRTGDLLVEFHNFGHVAVSGMDIYQSSSGLGDFYGNLFAAHFNTQKITRSVIESDGATFRHVSADDFLVIDDPDVHITDVVEDADGTLLVVDTGGWFRKGCPSSLIAKPEIAGAIYRIRKAGKIDGKSDYRGLDIDWDNASPGDLAGYLSDNRHAVRNRAIAELAERGDRGLVQLENKLMLGSVNARRNSIWALTRIGSEKAKSIVRKAFSDPNESVRHAACNSIWRTRDPKALAGLTNLILEDSSQAVRLAATRSLGRLENPRAIDGLLELAERDVDRLLEHALIYALIEINQYESVVRGLSHSSDAVRNCTLWALEGMKSSRLRAKDVLPFLGITSIPLADTALFIVEQHPEWTDELVDTFQRWFDHDQLNARRLDVMKSLIPRLLANERVKSLLGLLLNQGENHLKEQAFHMLSMSHQLVVPNNDWTSAIATALGHSALEQNFLVLDAVAKLKTSQFNQRLSEIGGREDLPSLIRVKALAALSTNSAELHPAAFLLLKQILGPDSQSSRRMDAAVMLASAKLTENQVLDVLPLLKSAGPLELPVLLPVFWRSRDTSTGLALVKALETSSSSNVLSSSELKRNLLQFAPEVVERANSFLQQLEDQEFQREARLQQLGSEAESGDLHRGRNLFIAGKGACITCHTVGETGREVGPDLSKIGSIRTKRDLLESILFPGATLARDFEPWEIETRDDQSFYGVIQRETADTVFLLDASGTAKPIPRATIKSIQPGPFSLMPSGLDLTMNKQELIDIVAFLDSLE